MSYDPLDDPAAKPRADLKADIYLEAAKDEVTTPQGVSLDAYLDRLREAREAAKDGEPATLENIAAEPWNAVNRSIPEGAPPDLISAARAAAQQCVAEAHSAMAAACDPETQFEAFERDHAEGNAPDAHEYFEQDWLNALDRFDELGGPDRAPEASAPLDGVGIETVADEITRGKSDTRAEPTREQDAAQPRELDAGDDQAAAKFSEASRAALDTPQGQRERDLAEVINQMADTAGAKDTAEHAAFKQSQADLGDQISRELDPSRRAEIRIEREAQGHAYAADLADRIGDKALGLGQSEAANDMHSHAELRREIAGELRGQGGSGPERPEPTLTREVSLAPSPAGPALVEVTQERPDPGPDGPGQPSPADAREQFSKDAAAVGREVLGRSAETVMVAEGPQPQRPEATMTRAVSVGMGPGGAVLYEVNQDRPDVQPEPDLHAADVYERMTAQRTAQGVEAQQTAEVALHQASPSAADARGWAREALADVRREAEQEREAEGPERPEGKDGPTAVGRYATLGR